MNSKKLSSRTIEFLVGILATAMIVIGIFLYAFQEPSRLVDAQAAQLNLDLDQAMTIYAQNCSVCHNLAGEGIGSNPPLNTPSLKTADAEVLFKTIARGLYGTAMPAWGILDGGSLSDYQIRQLVNLVQFGDWDATRDRGVNLGMAPLVPFTTQADPEILTELLTLPEGNLLADGVTLYAQECVACHGPDGLGSSLAPAINDELVRAKNTEELERIIRLGVTGTLMAGWEKSLNDDQIAAALELITRWPEVPPGAIPAPDTPVPVTPESLAMGADLYAASCSQCHGPDGQGSQRAPALNVSGFLADTTDLAIQQIITLGVPGTAMPAWGDRLTDVQIQAVTGFIRSWEPNAPEVAEPARLRGPWWQNSTGSLPAGAAANSAVSEQNSPWIQTTPWYQSLDERAVALLLFLAGVSITLIITAVGGLRRLARQPE